MDVNRTTDHLCNVQQKIPCVFETIVIEEQSSKRGNQSFKVVASDTLRKSAQGAFVEMIHASEKVDGTCVYVDRWQGNAWLWARHDRKPNKGAEKKFKKFQMIQRQKEIYSKKDGISEIQTADSGSSDVDVQIPFQWDIDKDFKDVPSDWVPASDVPLIDGVPQPDKGGHIPGWVPVNPKSRQHCWHLETVDLKQGMALVLQPRTWRVGGGDQSTNSELEIVAKSMEDLIGCTMELIGTFINGNPYDIGSKQAPLHLLVRHGIIPFDNPPPLDFVGINNWFQNEDEGQVEGVVWHCSNGEMYKLHRHHVQLKWPIPNARLKALPVSVSVCELSPSQGPLFMSMSSINGRTFDSLNTVQYK